MNLSAYVIADIASKEMVVIPTQPMASSGHPKFVLKTKFECLEDAIFVI